VIQGDVVDERIYWLFSQQTRDYMRSSELFSWPFARCWSLLTLSRRWIHSIRLPWLLVLPSEIPRSLQDACHAIENADSDADDEKGPDDDDDDEVRAFVSREALPAASRLALERSNEVNEDA